MGGEPESIMSHLHRRDPRRNMARFYATTVEGSLFGGFLLVRLWGRIGSRGRFQSVWYESAEAAEAAAERLAQAKRRRGYVDVPVTY